LITDNIDLIMIAVFLVRIGILSLHHQVCVDTGIRAASRPINTRLFSPRGREGINMNLITHCHVAPKLRILAENF